MRTKAESDILKRLNQLPEVEYPVEVVDRWVKEAEVTLQQYRTGELEPMTAAEFAAKKGIKIA